MPNTSSPIALPGTVQPAAAGLSGFDINSPVSATAAAGFKNAGYAFCIRYIPRTAQLQAGNLTNAEALHILNAGLALMAVQHVANDGWVPSAALGTQYGSYAALYATQIVGLPPGVNIWLDLEGVNQQAPAADVIAYCQAWYTEVKSAGYEPGIYVGWDAGLTSQQLYTKLSFSHYWRAYNGPDVATRGFQILQHTQKLVNGFMIDPNVTQTDHLGGTAIWLAI
ncbi:DUF1906 domain-containing protein [Mucilaginibacter flavus]|uniref:DUF1906 domain-containing protein n=1 Tax=Mucilaginibacter flavus TaxID=931504 RepID=UPI0025B561C8|nr:DUF1906 domain-containing protein [Mucilaginibacter flavus]MDN3581002.1 DUF1906 domain-containing protein [Mucilaginibacter flavus]